MEVIDNVNRFLGDDLKRSITPNSKIAIAAASFSIYAFEALKRELEGIDSLQFIFTTPTFVPGEVTDRVRRARSSAKCVLDCSPRLAPNESSHVFCSMTHAAEVVRQRVANPYGKKAPRPSGRMEFDRTLDAYSGV